MHRAPVARRQFDTRLDCEVIPWLSQAFLSGLVVKSRIPPIARLRAEQENSILAASRTPPTKILARDQQMSNSLSRYLLTANRHPGKPGPRRQCRKPSGLRHRTTVSRPVSRRNDRIQLPGQSAQEPLTIAFPGGGPDGNRLWPGPGRWRTSLRGRLR
jgi:hypothetical protein